MEVRYVKDYYQRVQKLFPGITKSDIQRILNFGFKSLYLHNSYGGDTFITDNDFWCYIGNLRKDSVKHFHYYIHKLCVKLRILYNRKKIPWDGYYYFALNDVQYEHYLSQLNKRGRKRKHFTYGKVMLYKILDECKLKEFHKKHIFKIPLISDLGFKYLHSELISDKASLIITRNALKFKDILVNTNKYEFI